MSYTNPSLHFHWRHKMGRTRQFLQAWNYLIRLLDTLSHTLFSDKENDASILHLYLLGADFTQWCSAALLIPHFSVLDRVALLERIFYASLHSSIKCVAHSMACILVPSLCCQSFKFLRLHTIQRMATNCSLCTGVIWCNIVKTTVSIRYDSPDEALYLFYLINLLHNSSGSCQLSNL